MKSDGHLGRNFLAGASGDAIDLVPAAAGHNLRLLRAWLIWILAVLPSLLAIRVTMAPRPTPQLAAEDIAFFAGDELWRRAHQAVAQSCHFKQKMQL